MKVMALLALACVLCFPRSGFGQDRQTVVDKYFQAIGGKERWLSIRSKFDSILFVEYKRGTAADSSRLATVFVRPNLQKTTVYKKAAHPVTMGFDGHVFWSQGSTIKLVQSEEEAAYFKSTVMLGQADLLLEDDVMISYKGMKELDDRQFEVLEIKRNQWVSSYQYYFDQKSGLLYCAVAHESPNKRRTYFKEYRSVSGLLVPFVETTTIDGITQDRSHRLAFKFDQPVNNEIFKSK